MPIPIPRCRSVEDNSNGIGGDKIRAVLMVAKEGRDFGVDDCGDYLRWCQIQ